MPKPDQPSDWRRRLGAFYSRFLPAALVLAAVVNLALTPFLPASGAPIRNHEDGSLTELAHVEQRAVDVRFGFYLELDDATDGGVLVVPAGSFVNHELAEGFADFEVVEANYDPTSEASEFGSAPVIGLVETSAGDLSYSIIPGEGDLWWLAQPAEGHVVVVPESVAPAPVSP
ncbi:MAG TPA: hypothetical protein VFV13_04990 [Acidimicrobiia bacterium]|nr:hypothetical protein [Acidimicrobiia bacterium]